jgi:hypothetical protein
MANTYKIYTTVPTGDSAAPREDGVAVSAAATHYSAPWGARGSQSHSLQLEWTGTPVGVFTLWYSNKMHPSLADDADWIEDTDFTPSNPAGSADSMGDNVTVLPANLKRIKYVHASGAGTLKGYVTVA